MEFTTELMDRLEETKNEQSDNDAITDDVAAKAYIEDFALETFRRGDDAIHSNRATRQTIDTFQAAATFLDLLNMAIWAPINPEMAAKSKYAKYHAVRIAKATKAGEDPNETNPVDAVEDKTVPPAVAETSASPAVVETTAEEFYARPTVESEPTTPLPTVPPGAPVIPQPSFVPGPPTPVGPPPEPVPISVAVPAVVSPANAAYRTDDDSIASAQKHAKWALSALNFEDSATAVKELRLALQSLGAS